MSVELKEEASVGTFRFYKWLGRIAVYRDGELVYWGEGPAWSVCWVLLKQLGYVLEHEEDIPYSPVPEEFDRSDSGWWEPPDTQSELESQIATYKARKRRELIDHYREELARLEAEENRFRAGR